MITGMLGAILIALSLAGGLALYLAWASARLARLAAMRDRRA